MRCFLRYRRIWECFSVIFPKFFCIEENAIKVNENTEKSNAEANTSLEEVRTNVNDDGPVDVDSNVSDGSEKAEETIKVDDDLSEGVLPFSASFSI